MRYPSQLVAAATAAGRQAMRGARARGVLSGPGDEFLAVMGAVGVEPASRAAARRAARHRQDLGVPARVQGTQAGHIDRPAAQAGRPHRRR